MVYIIYRSLDSPPNRRVARDDNIIIYFMKQKLLKPTYLKELCALYDLTPSKKYGQNYLISEAPITKMIEAADVKKGDHVIEIGPGFGILTFALADAGANVVAFEIEKKLERYWDDYAFEGFHMVWGNALKELGYWSKELGSYKVVANLPYQITSHVLRTILELEHKPESITVMVQKEVAERIVAKPGDMSMLAVSVQYYGVAKMVAKVSAGNFWPAPKVDSAVIHIRIKDPSHLAGRQGSRSEELDNRFFDVVRAGFSNKRKQVWSNLAKGLKLDGDTVKAILKDITGDEKIRAQELSVEQWEKIVEKFI